MSPNPQSPLPDKAERRTRAAYEQAAESALAALAGTEEMGDQAPSTEELEWPAAPVGSERFTPAARPARDPAAARSMGWLVTDSAPAGPTGSGRLAGVLMAVKDVIDVAGLPTRNGTPGGSWRQPAGSAPAWEALDRQGAVCVGKAATHEMAWGVTTPQIPNPVDPTRIAGGSSGGSAAATAAGVVDAALGTDTGGSIRIPAALCGVVGIRPTLGSVSAGGVTPLAPSQDVVGPLAHDVATCGAILEVLQGRALGGLPADTLRVGVPDNLGALDDDVSTAWAAALERLAQTGVTLVPLPDAPLRLSGAVSLMTMLVESAEHHAASVRQAPEGYGGEARALLTLGTGVTRHRDAITHARSMLRRRTARIFTERGLHAVATPTTACVAPRRESSSVELAGRRVPVSVALTRFTAWASATGLPAISVPIAAPGLPVGVQIMASPDAEAVCLALALALERARARS